MTPSKPAVRTHVACSGALPLPFSTTTACSQTRWLGPRRHAKQQYLSQCPDVIGQARRHRWRPRPPLLGRARAIGVYRLRQRLTYAGVRQAEIIVHVIQGQLLAYAVLVLAQRGDAATNSGDMLSNRQV